MIYLVWSGVALFCSLWLERLRRPRRTGDRNASSAQQCARIVIHLARAKWCTENTSEAAAFACCQSALDILRRMK
jgi:hypothetical protein